MRIALRLSCLALLLVLVCGRVRATVSESPVFAFDTRDDFSGLVAESAAFVFDTRALDPETTFAESGVFGFDTLNDTTTEAPSTRSGGIVTEVAPQHLRVRLEKPASFFFQVSGGSAIGYQWYFLGDLTVKPLTGTKVEGATSPLLNIPVVTANDEGFYYCVAFDPATGYARRSHYVQLTLLTTRIVHLPVIRPGSRSFVGPFDVQVTCSTPGAAILYLLDDGHSPAAWKVYDPNAPLTIDRRCVLRAYAVKKGFNPSKEVRAGYVDDATDDAAPGQNLGQLTGDREVTKDGLGVLTDGRSVLFRDAVDYYTFTLATERKVFLSVSDAPVTSRFSVELLSEAGVRQAFLRGISPVVITATLPAGVYRVKLALTGDTQLNVPYNLTITDQAPTETKWALTPPRKRKVHHIAVMDALTGAPIVAGKPAWLVIHGRTSSPFASNIHKLAEALDGYEPGKQIIAIDWATAAADNKPEEAQLFVEDGVGEGQIGVAGARWIAQVGAAAVTMLKAKGITAAQLDIAGHSWGTYVGHEVAARIRTGVQRVPRLIALDPASVGAAFTSAGGGLRFDSVARYSIAFFGNPTAPVSKALLREVTGGRAEQFGSPERSTTARDAFTMVGEDWGLLDAHTEPVNIVASIFERFKTNDDLVGDQPFSLAQFSQIAAGGVSPWDAARNTRNKDGEAKPAGFRDTKGEYLFEGAFVIEGRDTIDQFP